MNYLFNLDDFLSYEEKYKFLLKHFIVFHNKISFSLAL